jgi:hypothetical protein
VGVAYIIKWREEMKRTLTLAFLIGCWIILGSCSSFPYFQSDAYLQAGIRVTTDRGDVPNVGAVNRWSSEFETPLSAHDVGVWAANRLARQGRHDVLVLVELISTFVPPGRDIGQNQNMWRISVYPIQPEA